MGYHEVMALPIRVFWTMSRYINRIQAQDDIRQLSVGTASMSANAVEFRTQLIDEMGKPMVLDEEKTEEVADDYAGLAELKALSAML